ncbi:SHOCT domain-containing protein [Saccharomonospora iraqiensis]|uniref:SHOCT domain-containing protein n=1 Tax=Saccharomonospora iraqiensis TaxID=52698 RepID=UPI00022E0B54|nr:SHOCT domain-containing protein [Saccharomonospora iraqiensis]
MMNGWGMGGWMWIWPVLILIGLAVLATTAVLWTRGRGPSGDDRGTARRILDERFARGEIDEEEYRRRRDDLR